jgi:hypothetical protein
MSSLIGVNVVNPRAKKFRIWVKSELLKIQAMLDHSKACMKCGHPVGHNFSGDFCQPCLKSLYDRREIQAHAIY